MSIMTDRIVRYRPIAKRMSSRMSFWDFSGNIGRPGNMRSMT